MQRTFLLPGDSTVVELIVNTHTYKGKILKNARVMSNDTLQTNLTIDMSADVFVPADTTAKVRFTPDSIAFDQSNNKKQTVLVLNQSSTRLHISQASTVPTDMKMKIKDDDIKPGKTGKLQFEWTGNFPKADLARSVTFETGLDSLPRFSVPFIVKGTEQPPAKNVAATKPQLKMDVQHVSKADSGVTSHPLPPTTPNNFVTPKIPPDTGSNSQPKPAPKEEPNTGK